MKRLAYLTLLLSMSSPMLWSQEKIDLETMSRIRYEGFPASNDTKENFDKYKGNRADMIVILRAHAEVKSIADALYKRLSDDDLAKLGDYQAPPDHPALSFAAFLKRQQFTKDLNHFFADEKV